MRRPSLPALGAVALLLGLVAFEVATPARLLPGFAVGQGEPLAPPAGHTAPHDRPDLLCAEAPASASATLVARETTWATSRREPGPASTFDGTTPGPLLCARPGGTLSLTITNALDAPLPFHVHGLGEAAVVPPGETRTVEYAIPSDASGIYPYHALGLAQSLAGLLLVRGEAPSGVDHEIVLALGESHPAGEDGPWAATINGRSFPDAPHLQFLQGERVLVHLANLGEAVHTLHVHGHRWLDVGEGRPIDNKFLTPHEENATTAQADFLLVAGEPGDWMYHCHIYDHINAGMTGVMTVLPADGSGGGPHAH